MSVNLSKHWKTHAKDNDFITNVISANQHSQRLLSEDIQIPETFLQAYLLFPALLPEGPKELAHSLDGDFDSICIMKRVLQH